MRKYHPFITIAAGILITVVGFAIPANIGQVQLNGIHKIVLPTMQPTGNVTHNLKYAYAIGLEVGNPETIQAIMLQESGASKMAAVGNKAAPVGKRSYGLMQVQVVAARSIFERQTKVRLKYFPGRKYKSIMDEEIIALLLTNDEANIRIAAYHFNLYLKLSDGNWDRAVAAYNMGIGGVQRVSNYAELTYVIEIRGRLGAVRAFNERNNLG